MARFLGRLLGLFALLLALGLVTSAGAASNPSPTLLQVFPGKVNYAVTGGSLINVANYPAGPTTCTAGTTIAASGTATLSGVVSPTVIRKAYLIWTVSGTKAGATAPSATFTVPGGGATTVTPDQTDTYSFVNGANTLTWTRGMKDVTSLLTAGGTYNGTYTFGMSTANVDLSAPYCTVRGLLDNWALLVFFDDSSQENAVLNLYSGFQGVRGTSLSPSITLNNFLIPTPKPTTAPFSLTSLVWQGDRTINGDSINIKSNTTAQANVSNACNPDGNIFNGTVSTPSSTCTAMPATGGTTGTPAEVPEIDLDTYNVTSSFNAGDTSATIGAATQNDLLIFDSFILKVPSLLVDPTITKVGPTSVVRGQPVTYTLTVWNKGTKDLTSATVTDNVPAGLTNVTWSCAAAGSASCGGTASGAGNAISVTTGALPVNASAATPTNGSYLTFTVTGTANSGGSLSNTASVAPPSGTLEVDGANDASAAVATTVTPGADLSVTKTDYTATALSGGTVTYTIKVVNNGPDGVTGANVTDNVPSGLSNVTWTCAASANSSCAAASGSGSLNTTVNLLNGGAATVTVRGTVTATGGTLVNTASVTAPSGTSDLVSGNNSATDTDTVILSVCAAKGGARGANLLWSGGSFGALAAGSSTNPPTVRDLASVATGTGIRTDYTFVNKAQVAAPGKYSPEDGEYNLSNSTSYRGDGAWHVIPDHTSGDATGQMMVINAGTNLGVFYQETVNVTPNTNYELSAWIINLIAGNAATLPNFSIQLDRKDFDDDNDPTTADGSEGQIVYNSGDIPNSSVPDWRYAGYVFNSGGASQITIRFRNNNPGGGGNDLALDDLSFTPCNGLPIGSISGRLYKDRNNSGAFDAGGPDTRLGANVAVSLTDAGSGITVTVNTDANGDYSFTNVPTGTYKIWAATADPDLGGLTARAPTGAEYTNVTLAANASLTGQNFGFNAPGLVLTKRVRNCGALAAGAGCPASAAFGTGGVGKPGETLEYCIDYTNPGALAAANVVLTDLVPGNTSADLSGYGSGKGLQQTVGATATLLTSAADTDAGELTASQLTLRVASLAAGTSGQVCFRAKIK